MFAVIGKQHNLLRSKLSLASIVGILLEPAVVLCALGAVAAFHEEPFEAPYVILSLILFSLTFPGTSRVSDGYLTIVRDILLQESRGPIAYRGKTGSCDFDGAPDHGWWVGWVESQGGAVFFALNMDTPRRLEDLPKREQIVRAVLRSMGLLESE